MNSLRKLLSPCIWAALTLTAGAQDVIVMKDGSLIQSKVQEITPTEIKYKKFSNLQGPLYTIEKSGVLAINYENGEKETYANENVQQNAVQDQVPEPNGPIEVLPDEDNAEIIARYNRPVTLFQKKETPKDAKDAKYVTYKFGFTSNSILSNKDLEIKFELINASICCQYGISITNKTDRIIYIDLGNTFRTTQGNESFVYFDNSQQTTVTQGGGSGGSVGLGSVTSALGIGGTVGTLASGISVGGGNQHSASTTYANQRVIAIPPHGKSYLSTHKEITIKKETLLTIGETKCLSHGESFYYPITMKRGIISKGATRAFNENELPYKREYIITYSTEETFKTYSTLKFGLFIQQILGKDLMGIYSFWTMDEFIKELKKNIPDYDSYQIMGYGQLDK